MSELNESHRTALHCSNCSQTVMVRINRHATGNLTITCPNCGHDHYRYCKDGEITEDRWRSSAQMVPSYYYSATATSTYTSDATGVGGYISDAWYNTSTGTY
jgi:predicted RNA-binding Zn-ribbon protein involved in translation (DUF1610 family)